MEVNSKEQLLSLIKQFDNDSLFRDKHAHVSWRYVYSKHTFRHRLRTICHSLDINYDWDEFPMVTVISPTFKEKVLCNVVNTYDGFIYQK